MYFHPTLKLCEIPSFLTAWLTNKAFPERKKKEQKKTNKMIIRLTQSSWAGAGTELGNIYNMYFLMGKGGL
jgi:hypothetical protein